MPPKNMSNKKRDEEKSIILAHTLKILSEQGYEAVTMRNIGKECNFSHAKIYYYFSNKDEVVSSLVDNGFEILKSEIIKSCNEVSTNKDRFIKVLKTIYNFGINKSNYFNLMFGFDTPKYSKVSDTSSKTIREDTAVFYEYYSSIVRYYLDEINVSLTKDEILSIFIQVTGIVWFENSKFLVEIDHDKDDLIECTINNILSFLSIKAEQI